MVPAETTSLATTTEGLVSPRFMASLMRQTSWDWVTWVAEPPQATLRQEWNQNLWNIDLMVLAETATLCATVAGWSSSSTRHMVESRSSDQPSDKVRGGCSKVRTEVMLEGITFLRNLLKLTSQTIATGSHLSNRSRSLSLPSNREHLLTSFLQSGRVESVLLLLLKGCKSQVSRSGELKIPSQSLG